MALDCIDVGANINTQDERKNSILSLAIANGDDEIINHLCMYLSQTQFTGRLEYKDLSHLFQRLEHGCEVVIADANDRTS
jgi:ankyrin repeat protein